MEKEKESKERTACLNDTEKPERISERYCMPIAMFESAMTETAENASPLGYL